MPQAFSEYQLVYRGPANAAPGTLQRLRAAFVADLELPVERVKQILSRKASVLETSAKRDDLMHTFSILKDAGGDVEIVTPTEIQAKTPPAPVEEKDSELEFHFINQADEASPEAPEDDLHMDGETESESPCACDPLEQIDDLFRDLEGVCVLESGKEILSEGKKLRVALSGVGNGNSARLADQVSATVLKRRTPLISTAHQHPRELFTKRFWKRIVSWPEMIFSVLFSLFLVSLSTFLHLMR